MTEPLAGWQDPATITDQNIASWWKSGAFLRSEEKKHEKYLAKCRGCGHECRAELSRCANHAINCEKLSHEQKEPFQEEITASNKRKAKASSTKNEIQLLLKGAIYKNIPLRALSDNPYIKELLSQHEIDLPNRKKLKDEIDEIYASVRYKMLLELSHKRGLTLMIDGTEDTSKNSIYVFMLADSNTEYFLDLLDVSADTHSAEVFFQKCCDVLLEAQLTWDCISAFSTDNPTVMNCLRDKITKCSDGRIVSVPYSLHKFNSLTGDIVKMEEYEPIFRISRAIVAFIHRSFRWNHAIKMEKKTNKNINHELVTYVSTRWYTAGLLMRGLNSFSAKIKELTRNELFSKSLKDKKITIYNQERMLSEFMLDDKFYFLNQNLSNILKPIITVISHNEARASTIDEIFEGFLYIDYCLKKAIYEQGIDYPEVAEKILEFVYERAVAYTQDFIFALAFLLNPKFRSIARTAMFFKLATAKDVVMNINQFVADHHWNLPSYLNWTTENTNADDCKLATVQYLKMDLSLYESTQDHTALSF